MARRIVGMESFDGGDEDWTRRLDGWTNGFLGTTTTGARTGSLGLNSANGSRNIRWGLAGVANPFMGAWWYIISFAAGVVMSFHEGSFTYANTHVFLSVNSDRSLTVARGNPQGSPVTLHTTAAGVFPDVSGGAYITMYAGIHDSTGWVKVFVNNVLVINLSGVDTRNGQTGVVHVVAVGGESSTGMNGSKTWDDVVWGDVDSASDATVGEWQVLTRIVNGNGNSSGLTGSDGNSTDNYLLVDEANPSATDYVGSGTPGTKDTYVYADLGVTGTVHAVQVGTHAFKSGAEAIAFRPVVRSGGSDAGGVDVALGGTMDLYDEVFMLDPTDSNPWTVAKVNAGEVGFEVRSA